jgi:hypothetical protein
LRQANRIRPNSLWKKEGRGTCWTAVVLKALGWSRLRRTIALQNPVFQHAAQHQNAHRGSPETALKGRFQSTATA